ncbi:bifunctional metallophosphatase/5'-nucleotidase [Aquabacter sp. CN5-332]|uniref:bifunctional metallophosphatase/5'-nucleotidase n=1 Tax=Aquabacter sp. CN5-332 TaxID=3156608 RepID=UPI0032B5F8F2
MPNYTLQLLHWSDGEAGLLASTTAPYLAAMVDAYEDQFANTLVLTSGDNFLPGPFLAAGTDPSVIAALNAAGSQLSSTATVPIGAVDIAIHNVLGVTTSAIGNHEFDLGSRVLRDAFTPASGWSGANFVYLSSNLDFSGDADLSSRFTNTVDGNPATPFADASTLKGRIAPAAVINRGGERIGVIGATTQLIESISSPSGTEVKGFPTGGGANGEVDNMDLLAAQLQPIIDEMLASGVNKIILQSHLQQIQNEQLLASKLRGVDIIMAGGSNTRLGDANDQASAFPGHAPAFEGSYPLQVTGADGKTTLIVNTDGEYTYLGRLAVDFDENGDIVLSSLTANQTINGAYASTAQNAAAAWGVAVSSLEATAFAAGTKADLVRDLTQAVQNVINAKDSDIFGYTKVYLEAERNIIRNEETNLGNLTADANAYVARQMLGDEATFVVSLKNGGGIRTPIGTLSEPDPVDGSIDKLPPPANGAVGKLEGGVSLLDVENALRFNNRLMVYDTTPEGLLNILNWGAGLSANNGGFPQIGGVRYSYDPDLPGNSGTTPGSRIRDVALIDENGHVVAKVVDNGVVLDEAPDVITVVTLNFTANGGDGYPVKANGSNFRFLLNDGTVSEAIDEARDFTNANPTTGVGSLIARSVGEIESFGAYMQAVHGTPATAYDGADTGQALDTRIQNVNVRQDTVFTSAAVNGSDAGDPLDGTAGDDALHGMAGNDFFFGRKGDDLLDGGDGDDTAVFDVDFNSVSVFLVGNAIVISSAEGQDRIRNVEHLQFADGRIDLKDGNALVNDLFYYAQNKDVWDAGADAETHYATFGWKEGRDPSALFDTSAYLAANADVKKAGVNPLEHYLTIGWKEGRDPSADFDTRLYLTQNPDVAAAGANPLEHLEGSGRDEGRKISFAIGDKAQNGFDVQYYLMKNPDVAAAGVDAAQHYHSIGWKEGRDPNALFDTSAYLAAYADVKAAGVDPFEHYMTMGWKEGRDPSALFDGDAYLAAYPDVAAAKANPLQHFLANGIYEGRDGLMI